MQLGIFENVELMKFPNPPFLYNWANKTKKLKFGTDRFDLFMKNLDDNLKDGTYYEIEE